MFKTYFDATELSLLAAAGLCLLLSIVLKAKGRYAAAVALLGVGALFIYLCAAYFDPYLHVWDERFHALVAKNLMHHPLKPTLYDEMPLEDVPYFYWTGAHVWLHKQPLFLWQMALSFRIFGVSEFAARLPGAVLASLLTLISYRSGRLLMGREAGYCTALLVATSFNLIELVSGYNGMDQNDACFVFYVSASLWALLEYENSGKKRWIVLSGLFSGGAVLTKWLTGLTLYLCWGVYNLLRHRLALKKYLPLLASLGLCLVVFVPWQIYTHIAFPGPARQEMAFNSAHLFTAIEDHAHDHWYHLELIRTLYGMLAPFFILPAAYLLYTKAKNRQMGFAFVFTAVFIYCFFTLATTKTLNFTFVAALIVYMSFGALLAWMLKGISQLRTSAWLHSAAGAVLLLGIAFMNLRLEDLQERHTAQFPEKDCKALFMKNKEVFMQARQILKPDAVLFNVKGAHYVEAMFYSGHTAYNFVPSQTQYDLLRRLKRQIAVITNGETLPSYLLNDKNVVIIDKTTRVCE